MRARYILFIVLVLITPLQGRAVALPPAAPLSSECEAYAKRVQSESGQHTMPRLNVFPSEMFDDSVKNQAGSHKRKLTFEKDAPKSQQPFWRNKPGLMQRLERERHVLTSVTQSRASNGEAKFDMKVAGIVKAPRSFAFKSAQSYPRLKEVADNFRTVHYKPVQNRLYLVMVALGYQERMILEIFPASGDGRDELQFDVIWGNFKGMKGFVAFESSSIAKTEMSLIASFQSKTLPLPKILMGLALEVVTQKVAEKLRVFIESDYKQGLNCGNI